MFRGVVVVAVALSLLFLPTFGAQQSEFDATFDPVPGNEWWVEAYVSGNGPLAQVDARVDSGSWHELTKRDWGAWAASFHVPDGSTVEFRAHSTDGDTDLSQGYVWPEATPAGGSGDFAADFDPVPGNAWWVEVYVDGNGPIGHVEARADGGAWQDLSKRDWGAWAASFHVRDGSTVEFRAHSTDGDTDLSQGYIWPEATPTDDGDGGSQTGDFDAAFDAVPGNEWWVEVYVDGNEPISRAQARADGGSWHELSKRDWGAWAASFHVPDGSTVEFRAHSTDGDTDVSQGYVWPEATPTDGGGGSETGDLDVAFGARAGNEWWVETYVVANATIVSVEVRANGGTWHTMTERSWDTWAASFHAPSGSMVEFRATSEDGATDLSDGFHWPSADAVGAGSEWPREGSYTRAETWYDPPGGYVEEGHTTKVYHDGTWWAFDEWTSDYLYDDTPPEHHEKFETDVCRSFGPTDGVQPGDDIFIRNPCSGGERNATAREMQNDDTHNDGDAVTIDVWYATDRDPCNCVEWQVRWHDDFGLVTYQNLAGRGANGSELVDTNAPLA